MLKSLLVFFVIFFNVSYADDQADTNLFMTHPYFKDITKFETKIYLNSNAEKILYKQGLEDFFNSTIRSKIGKPLNKLIDSKYESKKNLGIEIILLGPYNEHRDIYAGTVELFVQNDGFGRIYYSKTYRVFNQRSEIKNDIEEAIEELVKRFVSDYFKVIDFDYSKMSEANKMFFLFKYRGDFEYLTQRWAIWDTIKESQQTFSYIFDELSKKTVKRQNTTNKNTTYAFVKNFLNKGNDILVEFWDYSDNKQFKAAKRICIDDNMDGTIDYGIQKYTTDAFSLGVEVGKERYYFDSVKCSEEIQKFYDKKRGIDKVTTNSNSSSGTGFFISNNGHLLTNYHVIQDSNKISILYNGKQFNADILAKDKTNDIALLKIDTKTTLLPIAEYPKLDKGENVTSLGYPLIGLQGNEIKATFGYINSLSGIQNDIRFLQFDNPTQPGNSGSPLINQKGEVIGIVTARLNQSTAIKYSGALSQNVNYALKMDYALPIIKQNNIDTANVKYSKKYSNKELVKKYEKSVVLIIAESN